MRKKRQAPSPWLRYAIAAFAAACFWIGVSANATDDLTQPIHASPDGHFLVQPDGKPFFWLGDTAWALFERLDRADADKYLQDRARKGFTVIQAVAIGGPWDELSVPNRYGELPLIDNDPTRPNPRYFEHVDWIVDRAAHYGLRIAMLPVWGGSLIGGWEGGNRYGQTYSPASAEAYGRWMGARYRHKGVIWILGGDINPLWPRDVGKHDLTIIDYRPIYDAMTRGIIEGDGGHPFITFHPNAISFSGTAHPRTSLYFHDRAWLSMNMLQSSHYFDPVDQVAPQMGADFGWNATYNYEPIADEYNSKPTRPVVDGETRYEDEPILFDKTKGYWKTYDSRNAAYHALFAGAAGHTYGDNSVHQFYDPNQKPGLEGVKTPWQEALNAPGAGQMQYVKALILSRPYFTRIPDQTMIIGNEGGGIQHIGATRDRDGTYAMIYSPQGQTVTVDMSKISGSRAIAWWYDPRSGAAIRIGGRFKTVGRKAFTPPTSGTENDWVLVLDDERRHFAAPGVKLPVSFVQTSVP